MNEETFQSQLAASPRKSYMMGWDPWAHSEERMDVIRMPLYPDTFVEPSRASLVLELYHARIQLSTTQNYWGRKVDATSVDGGASGVVLVFASVEELGRLWEILEKRDVCNDLKSLRVKMRRQIQRHRVGKKVEQKIELWEEAHIAGLLRKHNIAIEAALDLLIY